MFWYMHVLVSLIYMPYYHFKIAISRSDRYMVHDHVHRSLIEVTEGAKGDEIFLLAILRNHKGISYQLILQASTV